MPSSTLLSPFAKNTTCGHLERHPLYKQLKPNAILCILVALEKMSGDTSYWAPFLSMIKLFEIDFYGFIEILPTEYTISATFTEIQLQLLQNSAHISMYVSKLYLNTPIGESLGHTADMLNLYNKIKPFFEVL